MRRWRADGGGDARTTLALTKEEDLDGLLLFLERVTLLAELLVDGVVDPACLGLAALSDDPLLWGLVRRGQQRKGERVVEAGTHHVPQRLNRITL